VGDNPTGHTVETSVTPSLFNSSGADDVTIKNLVVEKYASPSAMAAVNLGNSPNGAERWLVTGSEVRWNHGAGIGMDTNTAARNNYVHHNCGFGFVGAGSGVVVESNEISYNNIMAGTTGAVCGYDHYWGSGGSKWVYTTNLIVRGNFAHHNQGPGLWTDINNIYTLYENNIAEDNFRSGIYHEISYDAIIRNNISARNGSEFSPGELGIRGGGIAIRGSQNVEIYGNTLTDNRAGFDISQSQPRTGKFGPFEVKNLNVHDNTVKIPSRMSGFSVVTNDPSFYTSKNNRFRNNTYILGNQAKPFWWWKASASKQDSLTIAEWKAAGQDQTGTFTRQ
jgi:Right handed beta helix region